MDKIDSTPFDPAHIEDEAWAWIVRFEGDKTPTPEDLQALHAWMQRSPQHHHTLKRLSRHWQSMDALQTLAVPAPRRESWGQSIGLLLSALLAPLMLLVSAARS